MSSSSEPRRLGLITWDDESPTGGNVYDTALVEALRALGVDAEAVRVGAGWPDASPADRARLRAALIRWPLALVDGIVAGNAPDEMLAAVRDGCDVSVLVHLPLADEAGLPDWVVRRYLDRERAALAVARTVICPSRHAADRLAERYGRDDAVVAPPGASLAPVAAGSTPPRLLCLGALTPTKNQLSLLAALAELTELDWSASIVGSPVAAPGYADSVARVAARLDGRVAVTGTLTGQALERVWAGTDLLVLPSRVETYGLVVAEALAHGIPAVVPARTGAVEALGVVEGVPPGCVVDLDDPTALASALRRWLTEPVVRNHWRRLAQRRRDTLPTWQLTADIVRRAIFATP